MTAAMLTACQPAAPAGTVTSVQTQAFQTALAQINVPTSTPVATETPVPTPTAVRTPPALPGVYQSSYLDRMDSPHTYFTDACSYLGAKWNSRNAAPGTIVLVIMFHGISKGAAQDANDITVPDFRRLMDRLKEKGFQAIDATQLADFLDGNAFIPPRSVVLIADDRHYAEYFDDHFRTYRDQWGWPVINAWISLEDGIRSLVLAENVALGAEGWVDYQSHGYIHNIPMSDASTDEYLRGEFEGSINDLRTHFNKTPVAIIWPGGGFGARPVRAAREQGYRLGFTVNPRGPLMFNWVPQADQPDPRRPSFAPEGFAGDPRMTLPRYWPSHVLPRLDEVRIMGEEAAAFAQQNKAVELEYYDIVCAPTYGPIN
jgi:peptidoglycan/xylan/chitin deacetylase (PgdA/CDA1 family)